MKTNDNNTKWVGTSLLCAIGTSLCCLAPVFAVLAGIGGVASLFSWVEPIRPILIGLTILLLGFAWYHRFKSGEGTSFFGSTLFLGLSTVMIGLLLALPYYSTTLFSQMNDQDYNLTEHQSVSVIVEIQGMTCSGCEVAVEQAVKRVDGVLEAKASVNAGTANVKYVPEKIDERVIVNTINATGLKVSAIHFNDNTVQNKNLDERTTGSFCPIHEDGNCDTSCPTAFDCTKDHLETFLEMHASGNPVDMSVIDLKGSVDALKNRFNSDEGNPRFIAVLSAVCRWCLDGAHKIKETILQDTQDTDFRLYIVWTDMLEDDSFLTAQKAATLINDPRVYHFYEGSESLGRTIARTLTGREGVAWDIYMFYGKEAIWDQSFPFPGDYVHQLNPEYFLWVDGSTFSFGPDLGEKLREYTALYSSR